MARILTSGDSYNSGGLGSGGSGSDLVFAKAAEAINQNDLLQLHALAGKVSKVGVTDFAANGEMIYGTAQTNAATGQILAQTSLVPVVSGGYYRPAVLKKGGYIYTLALYNTLGYGATLRKLSANGDLIDKIDIDTSSVAAFNHTIFELSNGNICCSFVSASGVSIKFAIYAAKGLVEIKALTTITGLYDYHSSHLIPLADGGFAAIYQPSSGNTATKLKTYDNAGSIVQVETTLWTRTGTVGYQHIKAAQLSDGNIGIAEESLNPSGDLGLWFGIFTTAAVQVKAFTQLNNIYGSSYYPEIVSNGNGYFCVAGGHGTIASAYVINNAGTLQGSGFSAESCQVLGMGNTYKLVSDGTLFYFLWSRSIDSKLLLTKLPLTGAGYITVSVTVSAPYTNFNSYIDAFYTDGHICIASMITGYLFFYIFDVNNLILIRPVGTSFGASSSAGAGISFINAGDGVYIAMYDLATVAGTYICIGKWQQTAIVGVAAAAALMNTEVPINMQIGVHPINPIAGSPSKNFDHSANTLVGNKGAILSGGAVTFK